jgi:uncharacterized membrane protein YgdD (TMEM256/DUF423 family)
MKLCVKKASSFPFCHFCHNCPSWPVAQAKQVLCESIKIIVKFFKYFNINDLRRNTCAFIRHFRLVLDRHPDILGFVDLRAKKRLNIMTDNDKSNSLKKIAVFAGILGAAGVVLGAFGAHALKGELDQRGMAQVWDTAVKYHLIHAVALLALAAWVEARSLTSATKGLKSAHWAAGCWMIGILLFSGSLYLLALGGPAWLGPVTPLGGLALIAGWVLVAVAGSK